MAQAEETKTLSEFQRSWCKKILDRIEKMHISEPFKEKVANDSRNQGYYDVISDPIDLSIVRKNLDEGTYPSVLEFIKDMRQVFYNAMSFYPYGHPHFLMAQDLSEWFEKKLKKFPRTSHEEWLIRLERAQIKVNHLIEKAPPLDNISVQKLTIEEYERLPTAIGK